MKKPRTIWELACEHESEHGGGMETIFNYLAALHPMTPEAEQGLSEAWKRYNEQMNEWARYKTT